jgi:hypothetical protein
MPDNLTRLTLIDMIDTSDVRRPVVTVVCERVTRHPRHTMCVDVDHIHACVVQRDRAHLDVSETRADDLMHTLTSSPSDDLVFSNDWHATNERSIDGRRSRWSTHASHDAPAANHSKTTHLFPTFNQSSCLTSANTTSTANHSKRTDQMITLSPDQIDALNILINRHAESCVTIDTTNLEGVIAATFPNATYLINTHGTYTNIND